MSDSTSAWTKKVHVHFTCVLKIEPWIQKKIHLMKVLTNIFCINQKLWCHITNMHSSYYHSLNHVKDAAANTPNIFVTVIVSLLKQSILSHKWKIFLVLSCLHVCEYFPFRFEQNCKCYTPFMYFKPFEKECILIIVDTVTIWLENTCIAMCN